MMHGQKNIKLQKLVFWDCSSAVRRTCKWLPWIHSDRWQDMGCTVWFLI